MATYTRPVIGSACAAFANAISKRGDAAGSCARASDGAARRRASVRMVSVADAEDELTRVLVARAERSEADAVGETGRVLKHAREDAVPSSVGFRTGRPNQLSHPGMDSVERAVILVVLSRVVADRGVPVCVAGELPGEVLDVGERQREPGAPRWVG